jgi:hypothetical protein
MGIAIDKWSLVGSVFWFRFDYAYLDVRNCEELGKSLK